MRSSPCCAASRRTTRRCWSSAPLQGLGFGGEWAAGAILVAEYAAPRHRGRTVAADPELLGRGLGPGGDRLHVRLQRPRRRHGLARALLHRRAARPAGLLRAPQRQGRPGLRARTASRSDKARDRVDLEAGPAARPRCFASLLATGAQGGYYTLATWVPTYLKTERGLTVVGTGGYLAFLISGAFVGLPHRRLPHRPARPQDAPSGSSPCSAPRSCVLLHATARRRERLPAVPRFPARVLLHVGDLQRLRLRTSPSCTRPRVRGTGQGFTYNIGRARRRVLPRASSASWPTARASAARWSSAPSATAWPCWRCSAARDRGRELA